MDKKSELDRLIKEQWLDMHGKTVYPEKIRPQKAPLKRIDNLRYELVDFARRKGYSYREIGRALCHPHITVTRWHTKDKDNSRL